MMTTDITSFSGQYCFLSNFFPSGVSLDGVVYPTVEHAFQAAKSSDSLYRTAILANSSPGQAKSLGRRVTLRPDWESVKIPIMADLVWLKFRLPHLRTRLLATGDRQLVEGNDWNDTFWGVCNGVGRNELGKILMHTREHIKREEQAP